MENPDCFDFEPKRRKFRLGPLHLPSPFPIASLLGSSSFWLMPCYNVFKKIRDWRYEIEYRLFPLHYHWLDTGLGPGCHDPDEVLLYAAMAALKRYIDESGGVGKIQKWIDERLDPNYGNDLLEKGYDAANIEDERKAVQHSASIDAEILAIWKWWTIERPNNKKRRDELLHILYSDPDPVTLKETENPHLSEMVFKPFEGEEEVLEQEFRTLEKKIDDDEKIMLHRLVDVKDCLWT